MARIRRHFSKHIISMLLVVMIPGLLTYFVGVRYVSAFRGYTTNVCSYYVYDYEGCPSWSINDRFCIDNCNKKTNNCEVVMFTVTSTTGNCKLRGTTPANGACGGCTPSHSRP